MLPYNIKIVDYCDITSSHLYSAKIFPTAHQLVTTNWQMQHKHTHWSFNQPSFSGVTSGWAENEKKNAWGKKANFYMP